MFLRRNNRGQSTLEYGVLIAVVVGGLIAMSVYMKRGIQGKLRSSADDIGDQYSPGETTSAFTTITNTVSNETLDDGATTTTITADTRDRTGNEAVSELATERF